MVAVLSALGFGLAPALRVSKRLAAPRRGWSRDRASWARFWLPGQIALSLVFLIGASLFIEEPSSGAGGRPRVRRRFASSSPPSTPASRATTRRGRAASTQDLASAASSLAGVASVGVMPTAAPIQLGTQQWGRRNRRVCCRSQRADESSDYAIVSSGILRHPAHPAASRVGTSGAEDRAEAQGSIIVNETMARRFWPAGRSHRAAHPDGRTRSNRGRVSSPTVRSTLSGSALSRSCTFLTNR